jgi:hypothetical protein
MVSSAYKEVIRNPVLQSGGAAMTNVGEQPNVVEGLENIDAIVLAKYLISTLIRRIPRERRLGPRPTLGQGYGTGWGRFCLDELSHGRR